MTPEELSAIEQRVAAATPGPWSIEPHGDAESLFAQREVSGAPVHGLNLLRMSEPDWNWHANREFITRSITDIPLLIAEVRRLEHELEEASAFAMGNVHAVNVLHEQLAEAKAERDTWKRRAEAAVAGPGELTPEQMAYGRDVVALRIDAQAAAVSALVDGVQAYINAVANPQDLPYGERLQLFHALSSLVGAVRVCREPRR